MRWWAKAGGLVQVLVSAVVVLGMLGAVTPAGAQSNSGAGQPTPTSTASKTSTTSAPSVTTAATAPTATATTTSSSNTSAAAVVQNAPGGGAPAAPTITDPTAAVLTNATSYPLAGTAQAGSLVQVYLDANRNGRIDKNESTPVGSQQLASGATAFSIGVSLASNAASVFLVTAASSKQESKAASVPLITQDSTPPTVGVTTPTVNSITSSRNLAANASDANGVASVQFQVSADGNTWTNVGTPSTSSPYTSSLPSSVADGVYQVRAQATDKAGNQGTSAAVSFTLDTTAPAAPTNLSAADHPNDNGGAIDLGWTPSTSTDVASQRVYRATTSGGPYTQVTSFSDNTTKTYTNTGLTNGTTYFYVIRAVDRAGNESQSSNQASASPASGNLPLLETLTDDFNDNSQDTAKWRTGNITGYTGDPSTTVSETSGQLQITTVSPADTGTHYNGYTSVDPWCLTGSYAAVRVVQAIQQGSTDTILAVGIQEASDADHLSWLVEGTTLYFLKRDGSTQTILFSTTYSPTTHLWWRIRESGGTVYADTSADGANWTNRASTTVSWSTGSVYAELNAGAYGTDPSGTAIFDDFNVVP
jgi:hypothetical protein